MYSAKQAQDHAHQHRRHFAQRHNGQGCGTLHHGADDHKWCYRLCGRVCRLNHTLDVDGRSSDVVEPKYRDGLARRFDSPRRYYFAYLKDREYAPKGEDWDRAVEEWKKLKSDDDAVFDKEVTYRAEDIAPRITYGTNPGAGIPVDGCIPTLEEVSEAERPQLAAQLDYMQFKPGQRLEGTPVDYVFLGACTNGRIEDFRAFASVVKGHQKSPNVVAWLVPGSWAVRQQIIDEGIDKILEEAGFELRLPSCSACLAMNPDKVPAGKLAISTSNRNFVGRQGPGARTVLASPLTVAASAITGVITDVRKMIVES